MTPRRARAQSVATRVAAAPSTEPALSIPLPVAATPPLAPADGPPSAGPWGRPTTLALWLLVVTILVVLFAGGGVLARSATGTPFSWLLSFVFSGAQWYAWAIAAPLVFLASRRWRIQSPGVVRALAIHVAAMPVTLALQLLIEQQLLRLFLGAAVRADLVGAAILSSASLDPWTRAQRALGFSAFTYGVVVLASHALDYYRLYRTRELRASRLEAELAVARLQALRGQLHPHFLFNTLNSIAGLLHVDARAADRMLMNLGDLLRRLLDDDAEVALGEELSFLGAYLEIERARMGSRLEVRLDVEPAARDAIVPALLLQPVVENAIRHGIEPLEGGGRVDVVARRSGGALEITVRNDAPAEPSRAPEAGRGIGLSNTRARLEALFPGAHELLAQRPADGGFVVRIRVPFRAAVAGEGERLALSPTR